MGAPTDPRPPLTAARVREIEAALDSYIGGSGCPIFIGPDAFDVGHSLEMTGHDLRALTLLARAFLSQPEQVQRRVLRRLAYEDAQKEPTDA